MTTPRTVRIEDDLWAALLAKVERRGSLSAAATIRGLVAEYVARPTAGCKVCNARPAFRVSAVIGEPRWGNLATAPLTGECIEALACAEHEGEVADDYMKRLDPISIDIDPL